MLTLFPMHAAPYDQLEDQLAELQQALTEMGPDFSGLVSRVEDLHHRFKEERFRLAVLGQFKRGKSTLLNALLGEPLLPTGVVPLTAVPTTLRYGPERRVQVTWLGGRCETYTGSTEALHQTLMRYVTERENPGNHLGILHVQVEHPSPLLARGLEMLDTPGIGSTIPENTQAARAVLPACDGALFILSPDPPITEVELHYLRAVKEATARVLFVMTKADLLAPRDRHEALGFLRQELHAKAGLEPQHFFLVSARQALDARLTGQDALWAQSGLDALEAYLLGFLKTEKRAALRDAIAGKAARLIREALFTVDLQRKAVQLPKQELERRTDRFEVQLAKIERERVYFQDRLDGDRRRLIQELDEQAAALTNKAHAALAAAAQQAREKAGDVPLKEVDRRIRTALAETAQRVFAQAETDMVAVVTARFRSVQDMHCREMEALIDRVRRTAADLFEVPYLDGVALDRIEMIRETRLFSHRWITSFTEEAASWFTQFLPRGLQAMRLDRRLQEEIAYLSTRNIGELRWTMSQNLDEAFRTFRVRMESQLDATINTIRASVRAALQRQGQREALHASELDRLEAQTRKLVRLLTSLVPSDYTAAAPPYGSPV